MKKLLFLALVSFAGISAAQAQTTTYEDRQHNTTNYVLRDGTVEDSHHTTIGYIKSDGTIEDSHRTTIGYIKSDGTVEDAHRSTLGRSKGNREQTAMEYFFFKMK